MWVNDISKDNQDAVLQVDRAMAELRRGQVITVRDGKNVHRVMAVEPTLPDAIEKLAAISDRAPRLIITSRRAAVLGLTARSQTPVTLTLPANTNGDWLQRIVLSLVKTPTEIAPLLADVAVESADYSAAMAVQLAKFARLVPAVLTAPLPTGFRLPAEDLRQPISVTPAEIAAYPHNLAQSLKPISRSKVPLNNIGETQFILFRAADGVSEHLAVTIGQPDRERPVLVRLHSACFTGDIFGSLKCDCGEQLRNTAKAMAKAGGGVLLYLAQEGRGIGLANKLRAYALQALGYDTLDADAMLGFEPDERRYEIAAEMLRQLGIKRIRLMTNNPTKLTALEENGLEVVARVPILGSVNPHNECYLHTKAQRAGHWLETEIIASALRAAEC